MLKSLFSLFFLFALSWIIPSFNHVVDGALVMQHWHIAFNYTEIAGFNKEVITVNGNFPADPIYTSIGDTLQLHIHNALFSSGLTVHFHGIAQVGTPYSDGVAGVTQCAIQPGDTYTYIMELNQAGTYILHGHYGTSKEDGKNEQLRHI